MTKYKKIMTMDTEELVKWLKQFTKFKDDLRVLRLLLESDTMEGI